MPSASLRYLVIWNFWDEKHDVPGATRSTVQLTDNPLCSVLSSDDEERDDALSNWPT